MAHSKPAPDIFLAVCQTLDVEPGRAISNEDSGKWPQSSGGGSLSRLCRYRIWFMSPEVAATAWHTCQTLADVPPLIQNLPVWKESVK